MLVGVQTRKLGGLRVLSRVLAVTLIAVSGATSGCERGPSPEEQNVLGAEIWEAKCQFCHTEGGLGTRITPAGLAVYRSPGGLVDYTRLAMPYGMGGSLTDDEYRAVAAYLLHEHGLIPDDMAVWPQSAEPFQRTP